MTLRDAARRGFGWIAGHAGVLALLALVAAGLWLAATGDADMAALLAWGERVAGRPEAVVAVVVLMALMLTFALPASILVWVVAPFHPPLVSVGILLAGSIPGVAGAYLAARRLGRDWVLRRGGRVVALLEQRGDLLTQCMLRVLPGFPHSVVNYAAGVLGLPFRTYLAAAVLGLAVKWAVYASALYGAAEALEEGDPLSPEMLLPMFVLAGMLLAAAVLRGRLQSRRSLPPRREPPHDAGDGAVDDARLR